MIPTEISQVAKILTKAGYILQDCNQDGFLCITDPTCIWPPLLEFITNAWYVLTAITGILLAGWAVTMLRGASHDMIKNLRTLVLIFGSLSVALPAVNMLGAGKAIVGQCGDPIMVSYDRIQELVQMSRETLEHQQFENFDISDSAFDEF